MGLDDRDIVEAREAAPPATPPTTPSPSPTLTAAPDPLATGETAYIWEGAEWWVVDGELYAVYYVPDTDPPIPYLWLVPDDTALDRIFGPGGWSSDKVDRTLSSDQLASVGGQIVGDVADMPEIGPDQDPYDVWEEVWTVESAVVPWLQDPEVAALYWEALIEGRDVTDAELHTTEWWQTHSEAERQWLSLNLDDPTSATQLMEDNRILARQALEQAGIFDPPEDLVNAIADLYTTGAISEAEFYNQIRGLADPELGVEIHEDIVSTLGDTELDRNAEYEEQVRELVVRWLGPVFGQWSEKQISEWASKMRRTPDAKDELVAMLRQQRLAVLPEYADQNLTYEDISGPWRNHVASIWGEQPDETDPFFLEILRMNDAYAASAALRKEGLKRGNESVNLWFQQNLNDSFGTLRRPIL